MLMQLYLLVMGIRIRRYSIVKERMKLSKCFPFDAFILSKICLRHLFIPIDNMIQFSTISLFNFDFDDIQIRVFFFCIRISILIKDIDKIYKNILIDSKLYFLAINGSILLFHTLLIFFHYLATS